MHEDYAFCREKGEMLFLADECRHWRKRSRRPRNISPFRLPPVKKAIRRPAVSCCEGRTEYGSGHLMEELLYRSRISDTDRFNCCCKCDKCKKILLPGIEPLETALWGAEWTDDETWRKNEDTGSEVTSNRIQATLMVKIEPAIESLQKATFIKLY